MPKLKEHVIPQVPTPSEKPDKPFKPPATSTTDGHTNYVQETPQAGQWGAMHRKLTIHEGSERAHDFKD